MIRALLLAATHIGALLIGFAAGIYTLPILTAPKGPTAEALQAASRTATFRTRFERNLKGSDFLHWGEGQVAVSRDRIVHTGKLAPGPDYKVYLTTEFVDTKDAFLRIKAQSQQIGDVKTFDGFIIAIPPDVDVTKYTTVVVWCEAFSAFITAGKYR